MTTTIIVSVLIVIINTIAFCSMIFNKPIDSRTQQGDMLIFALAMVTGILFVAIFNISGVLK